MAGLVPAIPIPHTQPVQQAYVYILASRPGGAIYVGVTGDLVRRITQHKHGDVPGHTKRYGINKLVYYEVFDRMQDALQREKKHEALAACLQNPTDPEDKPLMARFIR
jgi:putative endonuclease